MRGVSFMRVTARLKPGVSISQAQAAMPALFQSYKEQHPETADNSWAPYLVSAAEDVTGNLRPAFLTLLTAVGAVLLIACSNVANLLLVRFTGRKREISLRMALGAERSGIVRLFVFESTLVSVIAGGVGLCLALWTVSIVPQVAGQNIPLETGVTLQWPVLFFTLALSLATGLLMGLYPAWQSSRADLVDGLKEGGRGTSGSRGQHRFRRGLVTAQVGLSVVLLAGAAMLVSSFVRLSRQETGFRSERVWTGGIGLPPAQYPDPASRGRFVERLQAEVQNAPGVETVAIAEAVPLSGNSSRSPYARADGNPVPVNQRPLGLTRSVSPGYFRTLGIPFLSGRDFAEQDKLDSLLVVILSNSTAKRLFPNQNPIGRQILLGPKRQRPSGRSDRSRRRRAFAGAGQAERCRVLSAVAAAQFSFLQPGCAQCDQAGSNGGNCSRGALNRIDNGLPILQPNTLDAIVANRSASSD